MALVRQAQGMFWRAGYEATSLSEIAARTGVHKPSLYAAFAGKRGLFLETLGLYLQDSQVLMDRALDTEPLRASVELFLKSDIDVFSADRGAGGCYFICIFDEAGRDDAVLGQTARKIWERLRDRIERRVAKAPADELPSGWSREATSDFLMASHVFLAVRGRARASRAEMEDYVKHALDHFLEP